MKTAKEMNALIGRHCFLEPANGLQFRCRITNVKTSYGRPRVEIEAVEGNGKAWVAFESVVPCYENGTSSFASKGGR